MTLDEVRTAVVNGRCTWADVQFTLERALVPASEQIEILAGRTAIRPYAALLVAELVETGVVPLGLAADVETHRVAGG